MLDQARRMAAALRHRGPDASAEWADPAAGVAFGFRRLSIIDLSAAGDQPMVSHSGRYTIVFNGEVYNFMELARVLQQEDSSLQFRGHSDTEVVLASIERWGLEAAVRRFVGMFAFAVWDSAGRELHLVRDRVGVKPMYYGWSNGALLFASELKAFPRYEGFRDETDPDALALFLRFGSVPAPLTIYRSVRKARPGAITTFSAPDASRETTYWSAIEVYNAAQDRRFSGSLEEATERLEELLRDSVRLRMISDVPIGVFLSGGIDSSTVTALMQSLSTQPVRSFSIGFADEAYDESRHAARVAAHLGTDHTELVVTPAEAMNVIRSLPTIYDEPFGDSSAVPTFLVSQLARRAVTVSLSGDGGDELFAGYNRYAMGPRIWRLARAVPRPLRALAGHSLGAVRPSLLQAVGRVTGLSRRHSHSGEKIAKVSRALLAGTPDAFYWSLVSQWARSPVSLGDPAPAHPVARAAEEGLATSSLAERMMALDLISYLPDDILVKVDRASMSVSLEAREPLLDHRVIEFAASLPMEMKIGGGRTKRILRRVLGRYVPAELVERPKTGFEVPIADWLRGPLCDWAESLLDPAGLQADGLLDPHAVRTAWHRHLGRQANLQHQLWNVLTYRAWVEEQKKAAAEARDLTRSPEPAAL